MILMIDQCATFFAADGVNIIYCIRKGSFHTGSFQYRIIISLMYNVFQPLQINVLDFSSSLFDNQSSSNII